MRRWLAPAALLALLLPAVAASDPVVTLVAPYHPSGPLAEARDAFHEGRHAEALRLLTAHDDGSFAAAWLRAQAALESGAFEDAERVLVRLMGQPSPLSDRIAFLLGSTRERLGNTKGAIEAYAAVPENSLRRDPARLAGARLLAQEGKRAEALRWLAELREKSPPGWGHNLPAQALFLTGELLEKEGDKEGARQAWLRVWSTHALAPEAEEAHRRALALGATPSLAQRVERARVILDAHRNQEGVALLEAMRQELVLPAPLACEAHFYLGRGYRKMRQHTKATQILGPVVERCPDSPFRVRAMYVLGTSTTIVDPPKGREVWRRLAKEYPAHSFADDALLFAAEISRREGDDQAARRDLMRLVEEHPDGDFRAEALFRLFWIDWGAGRPAEGLPFLQQIELEYGDQANTADLERALYWQGRSLAAADSPVGALAAWRKLILEHPTSYYAVLARGRVRALDEKVAEELQAAEASLARAEAKAWEVPWKALQPDPHFRAAVELLRLGQKRESIGELLRIDRQAAVERAAGSLEPVLAVAYLLDHAGARRAAHQIARTELRPLLRGRPQGEAAARFRVAYPLAYRDLVERNAEAAGVPADLLQALMREESSLDPDVVSWAGAVGLTQLMPRTAQAVAQRLKLGRITPARLRDPALNLRLGSAYLGELLRRWDGNLTLATASYNAGPGAVRRWLDQRGDRDMDEFVEEIPIDETRNYVKRVLASFSTYRLVYADGAARFPLLLPAKARGKK